MAFANASNLVTAAGHECVAHGWASQQHVDDEQQCVSSAGVDQLHRQCADGLHQQHGWRGEQHGDQLRQAICGGDNTSGRAATATDGYSTGSHQHGEVPHQQCEPCGGKHLHDDASNYCLHPGAFGTVPALAERRRRQTFRWPLSTASRQRSGTTTAPYFLALDAQDNVFVAVKDSTPSSGVAGAFFQRNAAVSLHAEQLHSVRYSLCPGKRQYWACLVDGQRRSTHRIYVPDYSRVFIQEQ